MASIKDVAQKAGVGVGTVSRVLNNSGYVSDETREKIEEAMKNLQYTPNELARNLYRKKSGIIAVLVPTVEIPFFAELVHNIEAELYNEGFKIMLGNTDKAHNAELEYLDMLNRHIVDGVITGVHSLDVEEYKKIKKPIVAFDRYLGENIPVVAVDHKEGGRLAAEILLKNGCKKIVHFRGSTAVESPYHERHFEFARIMKEQGVECFDYELAWNKFDLEYYKYAVKDLFDRLDEWEFDGILSKKRYKIGLVIPTLVVYMVFIIIPIGMSIGYSFSKYSGIGKATFNGLTNYMRLFKDRLFWISLKNTMIMFILAFVLLLSLSFLIALLLNNKLKGVDFSKSLIFSPAIIAPIIVGIIWVYILDPNIGIINNVLDAIGASGLKQKWIGGNTLSPYSIAIIYFWQQLGYLVTVFIAGLKMIPGEVLEAVEIDGASFIQKTMYVTIPMMKSTISTVAVLIITGVFKIFEIVQQTTGGGPNHLSETLVTYSYSMTFNSGDYGYGMSLATFTFLLSLVITGIYSILTRERGE